MDEQTLRFHALVRDMRTEQKNYFANIAKARKTKAGADFAAAATSLKKSKGYEMEVDNMLLTLEAQHVTQKA